MEFDQIKFDRRKFLKGSAIIAAGATMAAALGGCGPRDESTEASEVQTVTRDEDLYTESRVVTTDIAETDIVETFDYDLVVIGAGTAGVTAATIAATDGVGTVAVLQAYGTAVSQGNNGGGLIISESDPQALFAYKQAWNEQHSFNNDEHLLDNYLKYSGEAAEFVAAKVAEGGFAPDMISIHDDTIDYGAQGKAIARIVALGQKPVTYGDAMAAMTTLGDKLGIDYYFSTPGVKLIKDDSGRVVAAIGLSENGYVRFNAAKAVILTTGCFVNNQAMLTRYCPGGLGFMPKVSNHLGDGHLMAVQVGANLRGGSYAKMIHDNDAGPMQGVPWLAVTDEGERFMNEEVPATLWNNVAKNLPNKRFTSLWDANYADLLNELGQRPPSEESFEAYIPGTEASQKKGGYASFVATYKADSLEELADLIGIPATTLKSTVERYNEIVVSGVDSDFGKKSEFLAPIDTPPFYGAHRWPRISTILSGVDVNQYMQVLDTEGEIIGGLYAAGNCGGRPGAGAGDWLQVSNGASLGFAFTGGYVAGKHVAGSLR
jgi:succinate dehydrogenase/fumarate reductase flavoprotein subunit